MEDLDNGNFTIIKTFVKGLKPDNNRKYLDVACFAKPELVNDIILEESKSLTRKIIDGLDEELLQIYYDCNINIMEFLMARKGDDFGIEVRIPDVARSKYPGDVSHLTNSIKQQLIYYFGEQGIEVN